MAAVLVGLAAGLSFLRDPAAPDRLLSGIADAVGLDGVAEGIRARGLTSATAKVVTAVVALAVGVGGVWALFFAANGLVERIGSGWRERVRPWIFVGPAVALIGFYLVFPTISTIVTSFTEGDGIANYRFALTDPAMLTAFRNNVLWLVVGTVGSVGIGLAIAALVDRVKREALAKTFIFLPMAISMVGASVIWRFVYAWKPAGEEQIGVLNAVTTAFGAEPTPWLQTPPINTLALILILVWLQTGLAMVVLSAALKAVPTELIEAARIDGAGELRLFFSIVLPTIRPTIITVATIIAITVLKVFDIVFVITGGQFGTEVVANRMFIEMFKFRNFGRASAIAVVLFVLVVPFIVMNVRHQRRRGFVG
jgi:alpha-glucoside transport system permease protein